MRQRELTDAEIERWTGVGMLAALAMVLGYLETFVPIPIPGVKLGLANIAVLVALAKHDIGGAFFVGVVKVLASGLLFGNPVALAYSAAGTLLAFCIMAPLAKIGAVNLILVSVAGALAHETGQLVVAMTLLGTPLVWYSAPVLAVAGSITGLLCGLVATRALAIQQDDDPTDEGICEGDGNAEPFDLLAGAKPHVSIDPRIVLIVFFAFSVLALHAYTTPALISSLAIAVAACLLGNVRARSVARALRPTIAILLITFVAQVVTYQQGEALFAVGPITVTDEALLRTWVMTARLLAIMAASVAVMHLASPQGLIDAVFWLLTPFRKAGLRTEGLALALNVALAAVPAMISAAESHTFDWKNWRSAAARFIARQTTIRT